MDESKGPDNIAGKQKKCAKCGACTAVCPVYQITGRESLTARGRLHLLSKLTSPDLSHDFSEIFSKCLLCGACQDVCPRGIDIPSMIIDARSGLSNFSGFASFKKFLARQILASPSLANLFGKAASPLDLLPSIPKDSGLHLKMQTGKDAFPEEINPAENHSGKILANNALYFSGCLANHLQPAIINASSLLLEKFCGFGMNTPSRQGCCGMAAFAAGDHDQSLKLAKNNIKVFSQEDTIDLPIFTSCATCFAHLRSYPELFRNSPEWLEKSIAFASRVKEFSTFLLDNKKSSVYFKKESLPMKVTYHDPCHLRFTKKSALLETSPVVNTPRELLKLFPGVSLVEMPHGPQCCGQGGLFNIAHPAISQEIANLVAADIKGINPDLLLTSCTGCLSQWHKGLSLKKSSTKAKHLAVFLSERL